MSEKVELELILQGGAKAVRTMAELEKGLEDARNEIKGLDKDSERFQELATAIQQAGSEIKVLEKNMESLEPQQKAEAFLKMGEGIAGGFAVAQGALALAGVESEELEKIQVKVQAAISIAMGVRMMSEAALMATTAKRVVAEKLAIVQSKLGIVVTKGQAVATGIAATAQGVWNGTIALTTVAMKGLKLAIAATGIGALVLAILAIGKAVYDWASATDNTAAAQANLNRELANQNDEFIKQRDLQNDLNAANTEAEKKLVRLRNELKQNIDGLGENSTKLRENADKLQNLGDHSDASQRLIKKNSITLQNNTVTLQNNINTLDARIAAVQKEIQVENKKEQDEDKRRQRSSQRRSERKAQRKQEAEELRSLEQELSLMRIEDDNEREAASIELDRQNALIKAETAKNSREQILLINEKYDLLEAERQQKILDEEFELFVANNDKFNEERLADAEKQAAIDEKAASDKIALEEAVTNAKKGMQENVFSAGAALFEKNKKISKAIAVSQTIFSTQQAVMDALAAKGTDALLPYPIRVVNAISAGVMGAASVRNILSENMGSVSAGGAGGGTSPEPMLPASTGAFSLGGVEQQAVKAFVVESEITDSQAQMEDINRRSTI